jgi:hypothetical protein
MSKYKDRCLTCIHWVGDKERVWEMIRANPICMDLQHGYPLDSDCNAMFEFIDIEVHGDAWAEIRFNANFGCIYHQAKVK